jgi:hypothetical protein
MPAGLLTPRWSSIPSINRLRLPVHGERSVDP